MKTGKIAAKPRDAVPVCLMVNGEEVKRYKTIALPDMLKELEMTNFHFNVHMDGRITFHLGFGEEKTYLHAAIDDVTDIIVAAYYDKRESANSYYNLFHHILTNYGIPYIFYTEHRAFFEYRKKSSPLEDWA